jgi:PAT family beta-lactamase induction signal transducer AmpG
MGYRIAMIASSAGALMLAAVVSWRTIYLLMAGGMLVGVIATLLAPEPKRVSEAPPTLRDAVVHPLAELLTRRDGAWVLLFVIVFKLPDVMAGAMTLPFMLDIGHTSIEIGTIRQGLGIAITIAGAFFGGGLVTRLGLTRSLWLIGVLQAISNLGFLLLAHVGRNYGLMIGVIVVENFCAGMVTAGFTAFLMSRCDSRYSATQFALLSSLMALTRVIGGAPTGYLVQLLGWQWFFVLTVLVSAPGFALLPLLRCSHEMDADAENYSAPAGPGFDLVVPDRIQ